MSIFGTQSLPAKTVIKTGTPLFGNSKIRNRIEVSINELKEYSNNPLFLSQARQQILMTNVDELCMEFVLRWGEDLQSKYKSILEETLSFISSDCIKNSKTLIGQVVDLLNSVNFKKNKFSFITDWLGEKDITAPLSEVCKKLESYIPAIFEIQKKVKNIDCEISKIADSLEPYIITSSFFSKYTKDGFPNELFISRLSSLLTTQNSIRASKISNDIFSKSLLSLISVIQDTTKTEIPLWLSNYIQYLTNPQNAAILEEQKTKITKLCQHLT